MSREYAIGETAWYATYTSRQVQRECPVCFGKRAVVVILGDGTHVSTPCDYCGLGFGGPRGYVEEWGMSAAVDRRTIERRNVTENANGRFIEYATNATENSWTNLDAKRLFDTEAEAKSCADALQREHEEAVKKASDRANKSTPRKVSWSVGYHRREAKKARESAAFHEARAIELEEKK